MRKKLAILCVAALAAMTMMACGDGTAQKTTAAEDTTAAETTTAAEEETTAAEESAAGGDVVYKDGTYTAETVGAPEAGSGTVTVTVTIKGGKMTNIDIVAEKDQASLGANAIKKLPPKMIEANSADVAVVAGASKTSAALIEAVSACLEQAK